MKNIIILSLAVLTATAAFAKPAHTRRRNVIMLPPYVVSESRYAAPDPSAQLAEVRKEASHPIALPTIQSPKVPDSELLGRTSQNEDSPRRG